MPSDNEPYYDDDEHIFVEKSVTKKCEYENCCKDVKIDCKTQLEKE